MASSSLTSGGIGDGESVCYLCLDDDGQPLRRDCACRGTDAGFVHLSCLAGYAATKSKQASDMNAYCVAIVRAVAQMLDLSTSHVLLIMQQPKVRDGMVV